MEAQAVQARPAHAHAVLNSAPVQVEWYEAGRCNILNGLIMIMTRKIRIRASHPAQTNVTLSHTREARMVMVMIRSVTTCTRTMTMRMMITTKTVMAGRSMRMRASVLREDSLHQHGSR